MYFRFYASEIRKAATEMRQEYQSDIMGKVALAIYRHHKDVQLHTNYVMRLKTTLTAY